VLRKGFGCWQKDCWEKNNQDESPAVKEGESGGSIPIFGEEQERAGLIVIAERRKKEFREGGGKLTFSKNRGLPTWLPGKTGEELPKVGKLE